MDIAEAANVSPENLTYLNSILPEGYESVITDFTQGDKTNEFNCILRFAIFQKAGALNWLKSFEEKSLTTWKVTRTFKEDTQKLLFKKEYRCQHNTKPKAGVIPHSKHTCCPSKLTITVKQFMKRSDDKFIKTHPCQIYMRFCHNHDLNTPEVLKHRTPSDDVKKIFVKLFMKSYSPSTALKAYKFDLKLKYGDDYYKMESDGAVCPTQKWVYDLYYKVFKKGYVDPDIESVLTTMEENVDECNKEKKFFPDLKLRGQKVFDYETTTDLPSDCYSSFTSEESCSNMEKNASISNENELNEVSEELISSDDSVAEFFNMEKYAEDLRIIFEDLNKKLVKNPAVFEEPIKNFIDNYKNCKTESSIVFALHTFGKYNSLPLKKRGINLQGGKVIDIQSTVNAHQKNKIEDKTICMSENQPKNSDTAEHSYKKRKIEKNHFSKAYKNSKMPFIISINDD